VIGTYAAVAAVCGASLAIGQAALGLLGVRRWSWLAPAVGLALLCAVSWGTVRLPGHGTISAIAVLVLTVASVAYLRGRLEGGGEALRAGWPVGLVALLAASLPFIAEGHFGILGTSFNPDMSQHLLAADRLASGQGSELLRQGYPLGPHAIVVALNKGLGIGLVQGFSGLTVAVAILAPLTALAAFRDLRPLPRTAAALAVGLTYAVASYFAQGAFKETMQALFLLAFVLALRESNRAWANLPLRLVPPALIAAGSVYTYSFPGLLWLGGAAVLWAIAELALNRSAPPAGGARAGDPRRAEDAQRPSTVGVARATGPAGRPLGPGPVKSIALALVVFFVLVAPEIGRMADFRHFETFDPNGPGLGNLFGQISPLEALGIWPSGDFRLAPGDGAVPAPAYYLGTAFALVLFAFGLHRLWRRRETAILSGLAAATLAYAAARIGGTPYTAAKAIEIASPLVALTILMPLSRRPDASPAGGAVGGPTPEEASATAGGGGSPAATGPAGRALGLAVYAVFLLAAAACALLALANAPVGPTSYSSALSEFRKLVGAGPTLVIASPQLLEDEHGVPFLSWELRGGRVCIAAEGESTKAPKGVRFLVTRGTGFGGGQGVITAPPPLPGFRIQRVRPPYVLWQATGPVGTHGPCPLIAVRQARQGPAR
jgi:hypothetical protein